MKTRILIFTSFLLIALSSVAQRTVKGTVYDQKNNPIEAVQLTVNSTNLIAYTSKNGSFELKNVPEYSCQITFSKSGFESYNLLIPEGLVKENYSIILSENVKNLEEVTVNANKSLFERLTELGIKQDKNALQSRNFGQDIPIMLDAMPSVVTTSDAGAGVGYTGIRVRGMDASRINVTINGIPVNDPESHDVYWVNMPDLVSSLESVSLQRGVSSSSNGAGAFGAALNLKTNDISSKAFGNLDNTFGSFNTWKTTIKAGTGIINDKFFLETRLSRVTSDGYIDRASSNLKSYYLCGAFVGKKSIVKAIAFSGKEITYQSWYGTPESRVNGDIAEMNAYADRNWLTDDERENLLNSGRTYNYYTYANQVDNYQQDNYQLHFNHSFIDKWKLNLAGHYTHGFGYYEEFKVGQNLSDYNLPDVVTPNDTIQQTDLIRRRWLDNHFIGTVYSLIYNRPNYSLTFGGSANTYFGEHFGEIIWARFASNSSIYDRYYDEDGQKTEISNYLKGEYRIANWTFYGDVQGRNIQYSFLGKDDVGGQIKDITQEVSYFFINPKLAINYGINAHHSITASFGISNREPVRRDFRETTPDSRPKHETLNDLELGYHTRYKKLQATVNFYHMDYRNQLVLTGMINDVGGFTRTNVDKSYRQGLEFIVQYQPLKNLTILGNVTLSKNVISNFVAYTDAYYDTLPYYSQIQEQYQQTTMSFSPQVIVSGGLKWEIVKDLFAEWNTKFVSKQYLDNTQNESRIIAPYSYSNFSLNYAFSTSVFSEIRVGVQANNLFNTMFSSNGYTFSYWYNGSRTTENFYYPQAGRNFMLRLCLTM